MNRRMAIKKLAETFYNLAGSLTVSDRRAKFAPTIRRMAEQCRESSELMARVGPRPPRDLSHIILSRLRAQLIAQADGCLLAPGDPKTRRLTPPHARGPLGA